MPTPQEVLQDPDFGKLPFEERIKVMDQIDPNFAGLALAEKRKVLVSQPSPTGGMSEQEFTQARQASATQEPTFRKLAGATIPTAAAAAAFIPGLQGIVPQMALGAGGTWLNQLLGFEDPSIAEVAKGAVIPAAAGGAVRLAKGAGKAAAELIAPGPLKEAGVEAGAERLGAEATSMGRAYATPASRAAYQAVAQQGPIAADDISNAITSGINKLTSLSNPPKAAVKFLQNMAKKFQPGTMADYGDVVDELQLLKNNADMAFRANNVPTGKALYKMRGEILDALDNVSPAAKQANAIYRREEATKEVVKALRSSNASNKLRVTFEEDPLIAKTFTQQEYKDLENLAMKITETPSAGAVGLGRTALMAITEPLAMALTTKPGRYLLRQVMKPTGNLTPAGAATVVQFMRAYSAQGSQE